MNNIKQPIQIFSCIAVFLILLSGCEKGTRYVNDMKTYVTDIENGETVIASRAYYKDITDALKDPAI